MKKMTDINDVVDSMRIDIKNIAKNVLVGLADFVKTKVVEDYTKRVQQLNYPLRHPQTKQILESMQPIEIARFVTKMITPDRAVIFIKPGTDADRAGRMQELYGGHPWQNIRTRMQDLDYVNRALRLIGLDGIEAKPRI